MIILCSFAEVYHVTSEVCRRERRKDIGVAEESCGWACLNLRMPAVWTWLLVEWL
jgi:hypothetical protein